MRALAELAAALARIDGRGYKAYKEIEGAWDLGRYALAFDHVQGDPFADPSRVRLTIPPASAGLPGEVLTSRSRRTGVAAHLARAFAEGARRASRDRGSGKSGLVRMESPEQLVVEQTAVGVGADGGVEARFGVGLPARGRRVLGAEADALLTRVVPDLVAGTLLEGAQPPEALREAAEVNEDQDALRGLLPGLGLVAFVAEGARLPRRSGIDDRPLPAERVVPFTTPESLAVEVDLPNRGRVRGMGVPEGVTLVVGGGFHGKSTVLRALERGVYNHRPGDGRELVATVPGAVKVRAEDGRAVTGVDISPWIDGLPFGADTTAFSTANASGSTSQAAALAEAAEAGATVVLVDEDTAATNFMIRDRRMQALVPKEGEPITPFVDRVRELHAAWGLSAVLVLGGSGDYLEVADTVIAMRDYRASDVTARARRVAREHPTGRVPEAPRPLGGRPARVPLPGSIDPRRGRRAVSVAVPREDTLLLGTEEIDLSAVEQVASRAQARAIVRALVLAGDRLLDGRRTVSEVLDGVEAELARGGLDALDARRPGDLAAFRRFELAAALNRLRTLAVRRGDRST